MTQTLEATAKAQGVTVGPMRPDEMEQAISVIVRGMRDNPLHFAAFGDDPGQRMEQLRHMFGTVLPVLAIPLVVARRGESVVGVMGMMPPGTCQATPEQQQLLMPGLMPMGPEAAGRLLTWLGTWAMHDPKERHWHLGPLAVDADVQRTGIGSQLMQFFCAQMDEAGEEAYLETDKAGNVLFYEKFGFEVVGEEDVLGTPNWFMRRPALAG